MQHWYTVVPEPSMRGTLSTLMGASGNFREHIRYTSPSPLFFFSGVTVIPAAIASVQADQRSAWCPLPAQMSIMQLHHQTTAVTGSSLGRCGTMARFVKCVTQFFSLPNFCGRSQCRHHQPLSFQLFVLCVVLSDN